MEQSGLHAINRFVVEAFITAWWVFDQIEQYISEMQYMKQLQKYFKSNFGQESIDPVSIAKEAIAESVPFNNNKISSRYKQSTQNEENVKEPTNEKPMNKNRCAPVPLIYPRYRGIFTRIFEKWKKEAENIIAEKTKIKNHNEEPQ